MQAKYFLASARHRAMTCSQGLGGKVRRQLPVEPADLLLGQLGLIAHELVDGEVKEGRQLGQQGDVGVGGPGFPNLKR